MILRRSERAMSALLAAVLGGLLGILPAGRAGAEDPVPTSVSTSIRHQVTFVARSCQSYDQVMANRIRDDSIESVAPPGRDSGYGEAEPVDPDTEARHSGGCQALNDWRFSVGGVPERKGPLSTVTGAAVEVGPTVAEVPRLDHAGRPIAGKSVPGAVTVTLSEAHAKMAGQRQLWVQGGTPADPLLAKAVPGLSFGVLRCAVDGRSAGNAQWVAFPPEVRHVFCYAYYVRNAAPSGTVVVRAKTTRPLGYPHRFGFSSGLSFSAAKAFGLTTAGDPVDATFRRVAGTHRIAAQVPAGWRLAELACAGTRPGGGSVRSTSAGDPLAGTTQVILAAGEVVTCDFTFEPPADPPGFTVRMAATGGTGTFGVTLDGGSGPMPLTGAPPAVRLTAVPPADGSAVAATGADLTALPAGAYRITVTPPDPAWSLTGASCGGVEVKPDGLVVSVTVVELTPLACVLRLARQAGGLRLKAVTAGGVSTAAFAVVPAADAGPGWSVLATTTGFGVPADAVGDLPPHLPAGSYVVTPVPPRSTPEGAWKLNSFGCEPVEAATGDGAAVQVTLTADTPAVECVAAYQFVAATRLQLVLRFQGEPDARSGTAVLEVSCVDGSIGRAVLPDGVLDEASLPAPLSFLEPTSCTVTKPSDGAAPEASVSFSGTLDPAPGNAPLPIPSTIDVARDVALYTLTVTGDYTAARAGPDRATLSSPFDMLPMALIGSGIFGLGALMLLIMVARSRRTAR